MVLGFGASKTEDVATLIAKKNYSKAIELIKTQLKGQKPEPRLRLQLADVLIMAGKGREAAAVLEPLADEYAREGFAAKAISVLKKIQKADPSRRDVEGKLATLIEAKQRHATVASPASAPALPEMGMEEIGFELPMSGSIAVPASVPASVPVSVPAPAPAAPVEDVPEIGMELDAPAELPLVTLPVDEPAAAVAPAPEPVAPAPVAPAATKAEADRDFFLDEPEEAGLEFEDAEALPEAEPLVDAEPLPEAEPLVEAAPDPMSDTAFADEVASLLDNLIPGDGEEAPALDAAPAEGAQIVVSPLFRDFSVDELVAVIHGLRLITYMPRQIVLKEGDKGESLYMLTSGTVRAFRKNEKGKQVLLAELEEGAFFGEGSILTGKPRTATVVAWTDCELLELDRPTLDSITQTHPHVWDVLKEFAQKRAAAR